VNTLEWMPIFLPLMWLCAIYRNDAAAAVLALVWIAGRALDFVGYTRAVEKRAPGFFVQAMACVLLLAGAIAGFAMRLSVG
jgi:glutathione S-transferase